jgi:nucleoside-diphosphate-sugar epimerase
MKPRILITGAAGYLGSILTTKLVEFGFDVLAVDILKYEKNSLSHLYFYKNFKFIKADVAKSSTVKEIIKDVDYIFPLAALVGAPLCEKFKKEAKRVNVDSVKLILKYIKKKQKIIYPTTNSGYGIGERNKFCDENSPLKPISLYGTTKAEAEKIVLSHKNSVCFRLATVFGYSFRMRTDLLVNYMVHQSVKKKKLEVFDAHFRRNFIHIRDVVDAFIFTIKNFNKLKSNIYNLGLSSANLTKLELAKKINKLLPKTKIKIIKNTSDPDKRDYFVSNKKIEKAGFKASISLDMGIKELSNLFYNSDINFKNNY